MYNMTGNRTPTSSHFTNFECLRPSQCNNFHQDWGKNSLYVIGHTHTSRLCLSPIRHSGGVCGPSCGASQSVLQPYFFHNIEMLLQAWQIISLTGLQHSHRPVRPIYLLCEQRADTGGNQKVFFFFLCGESAPCNMSSCRGGTGGEICENATHPTFYLFNHVRQGGRI